MTLILPTVQSKIAGLTGSNRSILTDGVDEVEFSALLSIEPQYTASVTGYAVEDGGTTSDHVRVNPTTIALSAVIAIDDPLEPTSFIAMSAEDKLAKLEEWFQKKKRLSLVTPDKTYDSYAMSSFLPSESEPVEWFRLSVTLQEIRVSRSSERSISLPQAARRTTRSGRSATNTQTVPGAPVNRSLARSLF